MDKPIVDRIKLYEPLEAIKLAVQTARNSFDGKVEAHLNLTKTGKIGAYKTERKSPLLHAVLGKQSDKPEVLLEELKKIMRTVDPHQVKKLTLCSTMGPGVKVHIKSFIVR